MIQNSIQCNKVVLRRKRLDDIEKDHRWRSDPELARLDAAPPLSLSLRDYSSIYRDEYLTAEKSDVSIAGRRRFRLAIDTLDGRHIGNITLYDIDFERKQAELGIMIGDKQYWSAGYGADAINGILGFAFSSTDLERIYLHTLTWNTRAQRCFQKCGFKQVRITREGRYQFVEMEIWRSEYEENK